MKKEVKNLPKLRFPEFQGQWELKKGKDLFESSRKKGNPDLPIYSITQNRGLVPRSSLDRKMADDAAADQNLYVGPEFITYNMMRMWQGAVGMAKHDCMVSPAYIVLKPKKLTSSSFFIHLFQKQRSLYLLWAYSYGLTNDRLRLYFNDFATINFSTPTLPEQQKIATFISAVDTKIEQLTRKKELLEQYKKGVMQKIFSLKIRFKDDNGQDYPDWEEKRLGKVCVINPKATALPNKFIYIDLECVEKGILLKKNVIEKQNAPSRAQRVLRNADILFQTVRPYQMNNLFFNNDGDYVASTGYAQIRAKRSPRYLFQYFNHQPFVNMVIRYSTGSNYPAIGPTELKQIIINIPTLHEQQKIANFLSAIDDKINAVQAQLTKTQFFKKGLLQKMFV